MKILVLNGSPKGENSITLQTALYLETLYPEHSFEYLHAGHRIKTLEKDFAPAAQAIARADLLLFAYPVYTFIAPCQLHRFIELMKEHKVDVRGKYASQITTSKHFYDVTAHNYVRDNCQDMGMKVLRGLSADMDDLLHEKGQKEARHFWEHLCWQIQNGLAVHERIVEAAPVAGSHPHFAVHQDRGVQTDVILAFLNKLLPPGLFDVVLEFYAQRAVVPAIGQTAVNFAAGINEAAALAQRHKLVHGQSCHWKRLPS